MAHYGTLAEHRFDEVALADDIRGSVLHGEKGEKLGKISDVIFDHGTAEITYIVVDTGGWLRSNKFLVPAERVHAFDQDQDAFQVDLVKEQIERFPPYDERSVSTGDKWSDYERRYREALPEGTVLHRPGSDRAITPEPDEIGWGSLGEEIESSGEASDEVGRYTPHRLAGKFPGTVPGASKLDMHPAGAREEESDQSFSVGNQNMPGQESDRSELIGSDLNAVNEERDEWEAPARHPRIDRFEELLRENRVDITARCGSCAPTKDRAA